MKNDSPLWGVLMGAVGITFVIVAITLVFVANRGGDLEPAREAAAPTESPSGEPAPADPTATSQPASTGDADDAGAPADTASSAAPKPATTTKTKTKTKTRYPPKKR